MNQPQAALPTRAREVALSGTAAIQWLKDVGWACEPAGPDGALQIFADLVRWDPFAVGRIWHTAASFHLEGVEHWPDDVFIAVFAIDGTETVSTPDGEMQLAPGEMFLQQLNRPFRISSPASAARLVIVSDWASIGLAPPKRPTVTTHDRDYAKVFENAVNALLNISKPPTPASFTHVKLGLESLFASLIATHTGAGDIHDDAALLDRARAVISERSYDATFDVRTLLDELAVPRTSLYRVFAEEGTTPAKELRAHRTAAARAILHRQAVSTSEALSAVAEAAGFGSVKSMQRAMVSVVDSTSTRCQATEVA
ncbi:helix-turn-helix transcriptional regulator [Microbacteriaceae bacterium VKM Ac-2854]|nr:helix-turn-helix transcriptional regulator [Microbacteriaceae bacterium VKM Ac-2854]